MTHDVKRILADWARLGVGFGHEMGDQTPDVERLILATAKHRCRHARLLLAAITWLSRYGSLVAEHRLLSLAESAELNEEEEARLGLMLEFSLSQARLHDRRRNLERTARWCRPVDPPRPLFEADRANQVLARRAERRACGLSREWGLWTEKLEAKLDTLRPARWIHATNPALAFRADFRGDLRATLLLVLAERPEAGASVSRLAQQCGVSRPAVVQALDDLEIAGHVRRVARGRATGIELAAA